MSLLTTLQIPAPGATALPAIRGAVNVRASGAVGDGTTDDAAAIMRAVTAAGVNGIVVFPPGTYRIASGIGSTYSGQTWEMNGATILVDFSGIGVTFGQDAAVRTYRISVRGGKVLRNGSLAWTAGEVGVLWVNTNYCSHIDFEILGFNEGLKLLGSNSQGQSYFTGIPRAILDNLTQVSLYATSSGWCNENTLMGNGSIAYSASALDASTGYAFKLDHDGTTTNVLNGNKFFGLAVESAISTLAKRPKYAYVNGAGNKFFTRAEWVGNFASSFAVVAGADWSTSNLNDFEFRGGTAVTAAMFDVSAVSTASGQLYRRTLRRSQYIGGGGDGDPILTLAESSSNSNKALSVVGTAGTEVFQINSSGGIGTGGTRIAKILSITQALDWGSISANSYLDLNVTVTGAVTGCTVIAHPQSTLETGLIPGCHTCASTDTVTIRLHNLTGSSIDPVNRTWRVTVINHS